jgi:nucleoside-diphosphate-sugar epimerase
MRQGKPVIVHGDGTSLWTLTHHRDFARGFIDLLANPHAIGQAVHITSDEWLNWNQIYEIVGHAAGAEPQLVHVPSDIINRFDADWGASLLGDKSISMIFDNTKIKRLSPGFHAEIPFSRGATEIIAWFDADPARKHIDQHFDQVSEQILAAFKKL